MLTYVPVRGGGEPIVCSSYQQSAIAHGYVDGLLGQIDEMGNVHAHYDRSVPANQAKNAPKVWHDVMHLLLGALTLNPYGINPPLTLWRVACVGWRNRVPPNKFL